MNVKPEFVLWAGNVLATLLRIGIIGGAALIGAVFVGCFFCADVDVGAENAEFLQACELAKAQPAIRRQRQQERRRSYGTGNVL